MQTKFNAFALVHVWFVYQLPAVPFKFESDVQRLMEMFPSESREHVAGVLKLHGMAGALDLLLQTKPTTSSLQTPEVCIHLCIT